MKMRLKTNDIQGWHWGSWFADLPVYIYSLLCILFWKNRLFNACRKSRGMKQKGVRSRERKEKVREKGKEKFSSWAITNPQLCGRTSLVLTCALREEHSQLLKLAALWTRRQSNADRQKHPFNKVRPKEKEKEKSKAKQICSTIPTV